MDPQPGTKATLTKDERHVLIHTMVVHLLAQSDAELRRLFDVNQRELTELTNSLVTKVWIALQAKWEALKAEPQLVGGGILRTNILKAMGEIEYGIKHLDKASRENLDNIAKIKMIQELYNVHRNVHKGKHKATTQVELALAASASTKRPRAQEERGHFMNGPPFIFNLEKNQIVFAAERELGRGAFATALKCTVNDENFPNEEYVAKVFNQGDRGLSAEACAAMEATRLTVTHRGIVAPLGLFRDEERPIVIFPFWNGGNIASWIWQARSTGKELPPRDLISISRDIGDVNRVRKKIFHIISALIYTIDFIHSRDILHNDLHQRNVFLHFSKKTDDVYAGLGDWGKSTRARTFHSAVQLPDNKAATIAEWSSRYPWIAPECFSRTPPPYSRAQDVYALCYLIKRLLSIAKIEREDPALKLVTKITEYADRGMSKNPDQRPPAYDLLNCLNGARNFGVIIDRNSGLRPFDE